MPNKNVTVWFGGDGIVLGAIDKDVRHFAVIIKPSEAVRALARTIVAMDDTDKMFLHCGPDQKPTATSLEKQSPVEPVREDYDF